MSNSNKENNKRILINDHGFKKKIPAPGVDIKTGTKPPKKDEN